MLRAIPALRDLHVAPDLAASAAPAALAEAPMAEALDECPRGAHWSIHKFGGTCVATADRIREAAKLIAAGSQQGQQVCFLLTSMTTL